MKEGTDLFGRIHIMVKIHAVYNVFALTGYANRILSKFFSKSYDVIFMISGTAIFQNTIQCSCMRYQTFKQRQKRLYLFIFSGTIFILVCLKLPKLKWKYYTIHSKTLGHLVNLKFLGYLDTLMGLRP